VDVKGKAYEEIVGSNLRGDRGEFFTPRNICSMAVTMLDPGPEDVVLDPACGTGGFLIIAMNHVVEKIRTNHQAKQRNRDSATDSERYELYRATTAYLDNKLLVIDLNPNLVKASKMNMVMNNDGAGGLYQGNSLANPATWSSELRDRDLLGNVDLLLTNPPFGSKIVIDDPAILEQYELAHVWDYDLFSQQYRIREPRILQKSQPPEILFIERCVQFLKPGTGTMAIVLPDAILGAPGLVYVREWILRNTTVLASVDLHPDAFQPKNSTQTSVLVLRRKSEEQIELEVAAGRTQEYDVFMALANHIGHDKRGNETYVRDELGNIVLDMITETDPDPDGEGNKKIVRAVKRVDDNTQELAQAFQSWARSL
jgi:type I restriction enzyme M protein